MGKGKQRLRTGLYRLLTCLSIPACARAWNASGIGKPDDLVVRPLRFPSPAILPPHARISNQQIAGCLFDSLQRAAEKCVDRTGKRTSGAKGRRFSIIYGPGVQAYGSNLRVGTLGYSEPRVGVLRIAENVDTRGCSR
jgi:hypothetical protein